MLYTIIIYYYYIIYYYICYILSYAFFDVTMGSYDEVEICELVGLYFLNRLSTVIDKSSVGLYRDDGLAAINNANGPKLDRIRKVIITLFKEEGLSITIE